MDRPMNNFVFKLMSFEFGLRYLFSPPQNTLKEIGIKLSFWMLDYGCGPGSYSIATAEFVGKSGKVYALDIHPLAIQRIQKIASKKGLTNIETIRSDCATGLSDRSIDVVLLYNTLHDLSRPNFSMK
jgi:ubiquinone/menaquinone biosynthesis C-methylase UbiE